MLRREGATNRLAVGAVDDGARATAPVVGVLSVVVRERRAHEQERRDGRQSEDRTLHVLRPSLEVRRRLEVKRPVATPGR